MTKFSMKEYQELTPIHGGIIDELYRHYCGARGFDDCNSPPKTDDDLNEIFDILTDCDGCVPEDYIGEVLEDAIYLKMYSPFAVARDVFESSMRKKYKIKKLLSIVVIQVDYERGCLINISGCVDNICYLQDGSKAWNFHFETLKDIAEFIEEKALEMTNVFETMYGELGDAHWGNP